MIGRDMTESEVSRAREYWLKRHRELAVAIGVTAARLSELGVRPPALNPDDQTTEEIPVITPEMLGEV